MAGKEDESHVLSRQSVPEILQERGHLVLARIGGQQHLESQALQFLRDVGGVVGRIDERSHILVGGVADDQRQTLAAFGRQKRRDRSGCGSDGQGHKHEKSLPPHARHQRLLDPADEGRRSD